MATREWMLVKVGVFTNVVFPSPTNVKTNVGRSFVAVRPAFNIYIVDGRRRGNYTNGEVSDSTCGMNAVGWGVFQLCNIAGSS